MTDPYEVLGVARDADDETIRHRYLELVRQFPPDRNPEKFAAVREAYERTRDPVTRLDSQLFDIRTSDSIPAIARDLRKRMRNTRIPLATLLARAQRM
jgi:curved DNA-binding protein CbpA